MDLCIYFSMFYVIGAFCREQCMEYLYLRDSGGGGAENDGHENDGPSKLQGMKMHDMKMQDMKMQRFHIISYQKVNITAT